MKRRIVIRNTKKAGDLLRLPLIDKALVGENLLQFVADSGTMKAVVRFTGSGSTGEPLKVNHDRYSLLTNIAFGERKRSVFKKTRGITFGGKEMVILYGGHGMSPGSRRLIEELGRLSGSCARMEVVNCRKIPTPETGKVRPDIALSRRSPGQ